MSIKPPENYTFAISKRGSKRNYTNEKRYEGMEPGNRKEKKKQTKVHKHNK